MKKNLIVTLAMALVILNSCAGTTTKVPAAGSVEASATTVSDTRTEESSITTTEAAVPDTVTDQVTTADKPQNDFTMPDQSFIGVWSEDASKVNQILIYEITEASVKFNTGIAGLFGFDATAMISDGKLVFGDGISPGYSGLEGIRGRLEFSDNSITVIYEDFGDIEGSEFYDDTYTFSLKDENSDVIVSQYKATLPK